MALENRKEPAALQYIFKLLDIEDQGHLNVFSLNYFFRVLVFCLRLKNMKKTQNKHTLILDILTLTVFVLL